MKMSKIKKWKVTERDSKIAAQILSQFLFTSDMDEVTKVWNNIYKMYGLCDDPFTHLPCSPGDYAKSSLEYDKQCMIEKYGHCDGLD